MSFDKAEHDRRFWSAVATLQELGDQEEEDQRLEAELHDAELCGDVGQMERVAEEAAFGRSNPEAARQIQERNERELLRSKKAV